MAVRRPAWPPIFSTGLISRCCSSSHGPSVAAAPFTGRRPTCCYRRCGIAPPTSASRRSTSRRTPTARRSTRCANRCPSARRRRTPPSASSIPSTTSRCCRAVASSPRGRISIAGRLAAVSSGCCSRTSTGIHVVGMTCSWTAASPRVVDGTTTPTTANHRRPGLIAWTFRLPGGPARTTSTRLLVVPVPQRGAAAGELPHGAAGTRPAPAHGPGCSRRAGGAPRLPRPLRPAAGRRVVDRLATP